MASAASIADVERRLREGDETVTADDLLRAELAERWARMQIEQAARAAAERAEAERRARIAALRAAAPDRIGPAVLDKPRARLERAVAEWVAACADYDAARGALWAELSALGAGPPDVAFHDAGYGNVTIDGTTYRPAPVQRGIAEAARSAIRDSYPRAHIALDKA